MYCGRENGGSYVGEDLYCLFVARLPLTWGAADPLTLWNDQRHMDILTDWLLLGGTANPGGWGVQ